MAVMFLFYMGMGAHVFKDLLQSRISGLFAALISPIKSSVNLLLLNVRNEKYNKAECGM
jgi:hypothetical protein